MKLIVRKRVLISLILIFVSSIFILRNPYKIKTFLSYSTRPIWDTDPYPTAPIINLATDELFNTQPVDYICRIHNGSSPRELPLPQIWDAIMFSHEIEMLEIHFMELDDVVDKFIILESNITYSGVPKELNYERHRERFKKWHHKIAYHPFLETNTDGFSYKPGDFNLETQQRAAMTAFINSLNPPTSPPPLVLIADTDEIPYANTLRLIKACRFPAVLHLGLIPFVYSFEWISGDLDSWHCQIHEWLPGRSYYKHSSKTTDDYVTDAGVHCSFCFRHISDFQFKMRAYGHSDRLGDNPESLLRPDRIQHAICNGENIFGMLPEAFTFFDLFRRWKGTAERKMTARDAPTPVRADPEKYAYLLPGGCERELKPRDDGNLSLAIDFGLDGDGF